MLRGTALFVPLSAVIAGAVPTPRRARSRSSARASRTPSGPARTPSGLTSSARASSTAATPAPATPPNKAVVFRILFDEHLARVRRHLACYVDDPDEVDEIAAEVFTIAWRKLRPHSPMGLAWLLRTADNKLKDAARRHRSREQALVALTRGMREDTGDLHPLEALALREAMTSLSARERQVVVLTYWDELSAGETAAVLRCSPASVWTTLTRARAKLRAQLETKEES